MKLFLFLEIAVLAFVSATEDSDKHSEELFIKPLHNGLIYSYFQFTTTVQQTEESNDHYRLFPKSLGEVLHKYDVQELHLSLTQGLWREEMWGYPMEDAPPGAQLWVWFKPRKTNIDESWTELINIFSGMFCASLNFMDSTNTIVPKLAFRPQGITTHIYDKFQRHNVRYAALPKEIVCTENLTPWKKLLPCGSRAGLGSLMNSLKLYDGNYHSLGLHYRPICRDGVDCNNTDSELKQTLSFVFDPVISSGVNKQDWSLKKNFGRFLVNSCPVATSSKVYVDITSNKTMEPKFTLTPSPSKVVDFKRGSGKHVYAVYNVADFVVGDNVLNIDAKYTGPVVYGAMSKPVLHAQRFQSGYGQDKGGITTLIYNNHPRRDITVAYMEIVPWFLRLYFHTLEIESFPQGQENRNIWKNGTAVKPAFTHYKPGKDREKSYHLELLFTLPALSVTRLSIQFDRALLKWTEYPPDANHGFYVDSAVISTVVPTARYYTAVQQNASTIAHILSDESTQFFLRLYTESLLVTLPTPDFSMPYNVICLACTVVAIAFGSIHNLTTRQFKLIDPTKRKGLLTKIKEKFSRNKQTNEKGSGEVTGCVEQTSEGHSRAGMDWEQAADLKDAGTTKTFHIPQSGSCGVTNSDDDSNDDMEDVEMNENLSISHAAATSIDQKSKASFNKNSSSRGESQVDDNGDGVDEYDEKIAGSSSHRSKNKTSPSASPRARKDLGKKKPIRI